MKPIKCVILLALPHAISAAAFTTTATDASYIEELHSEPEAVDNAIKEVLSALERMKPLDLHPRADSQFTPSFDFTESQWAVVEALSEAFIPEIETSAAAVLMSDVSPELQDIFAHKSPIGNGNFRMNVRNALSAADPDNSRTLKLTIDILSRRSLAFTFTQSFTLLTEMSIADRQKFIIRMRNSILEAQRQLYRSVLDLAMLGLYYSDDRMLDALGFYYDTKDALRFAQQPFWQAPIERAPASSSAQSPWQIDTDVVIVGSGSTGGVVASRLAKAGVRVVVLEKGYQVQPSELGRDEFETERRTYELSNKLLTKDRAMNILAGATLGGGGAINWSNSLRLPNEIRQEWAAYGVPWITSKIYDDAQDYVWNVMGTTYDYGNHSFTNQLILDGSKKLGYPSQATAQNTGRHIPNTGFLGFGYRFGPKGGIVNWLYEAVNNGAKIVDRCQVNRILRSNGRATGVEATVNSNTRLIVNAKHVVSCCGALQTPPLLRRSGFRNRHIGQGLQLHPVTAVYGDFDEIVNKADDTIMTSVSSKDANMDGQYHGARIEAFNHLLSLTMKFLPWNTGTIYRKLSARYKHLAMVLVLARDKGHGKMAYNGLKPTELVLDYKISTFDLRALQQGTLTGANLLYIQGANMIIMPHPNVPIFQSRRPSSQRRLDDADYQAWYAQAAQVPFERYFVGLGSAHQMASCRMSNQGAQNAAVDERGRLHECQNVHIADTSVFPTSPGVNPMITTMAVAHVLTGFLLEDMGIRG